MLVLTMQQYSLLKSCHASPCHIISQEKLPWAEEVLVSKAELDQQVAELTMQTEYQLRLKDLHVQARVARVTQSHAPWVALSCTTQQNQYCCAPF